MLLTKYSFICFCAACPTFVQAGWFKISPLDRKSPELALIGWHSNGKLAARMKVVPDIGGRAPSVEFSFPACSNGKWVSVQIGLTNPPWQEPDRLRFTISRGSGPAQLKMILNESDRDRWFVLLPPGNGTWQKVSVPLTAEGLKSYRHFGDGKLDASTLTTLQFAVEGKTPAFTFRIRQLEVEGTPRPAVDDPGDASRFQARLGPYTRPEFRTLYRKFVRYDPQSGMCQNAQGPFFVLSPVYVHVDPAMVGYNPGEFLGITESTRRQIVPEHLDEDCAHARQLGFNCFNIRFLPTLIYGGGKWLRTWDGRNAWEVYDRILDAVERNGMFTVMPVWGAKPRFGEVPDSEAFLQPDSWREHCREVGRAVRRYRNRKVILAWQVGLETASMPLFAARPSVRELHHPVLRKRFQEYLSAKYRGDISRLKRIWGGGYVESPEGKFTYSKNAFQDLTAFDQVPLPRLIRWNWHRHLDPVMIDFNYFRESFYIDRTNELIDAIRANDPNHLVFFDFAGEPVSYQNIWCGRNGTRLKADLITFGGGYIPGRCRPKWKALWEGVNRHFLSTMEYCRSIAYNAPMAFRASGTRPAMIGSGEFGKSCIYEKHGASEAHDGSPGARMLPGQEEAQLRWMSSLFTDYLGAGAAYTRVYDYGSMRQPKLVGARPYDHRICLWFRDLMAAVRRQQALFSPQRNARVAILRNKANYFSNFDYLDTDNVFNLGSILYQLHVPFDVLTEDIIAGGPALLKVDLRGYDFVFIPHQRQLFRPESWSALRQWLESRPGRGLCLGLWQGLDRYLNPAEPCADMVYLAAAKAESIETVIGECTLKTLAPIANVKTGEKIRINFTKPGGGFRFRKDMLVPVATLGPAAGAAPLARIGAETVAALHRLPNASVVYSFGFPLGFTWYGKHNELLVPDAMNGLYGALLREAGILPIYQAPSNLGIWTSTNQRLLLVKKRGDWARPGPVIIPRLGPAAYTGAEARIEKGRTVLYPQMPEGEWTGWLERIAEFDGSVPLTVTKAAWGLPACQELSFTVSAARPVGANLLLAPERKYEVKVGTTNRVGTSSTEGRLAIRIPAGQKTRIQARAILAPR